MGEKIKAGKKKGTGSGGGARLDGRAPTGGGGGWEKETNLCYSGRKKTIRAGVEKMRPGGG